MSLKNNYRFFGISIVLLAVVLFLAPCDETIDQDGLLWNKNWNLIEFSAKDAANSEENLDYRYIQESHLWKDRFYVEVRKTNSKKESAKNWGMIEEVYRYPATMQVRSIFSNLSKPKVEAIYTASEDLIKKTGLDNPQAKVTLSKGIVLKEMLIGKFAPNNRVYVAIKPNKEIYILQKNVIDTLFNANLKQSISYGLLDPRLQFKTIMVIYNTENQKKKVTFHKSLDENQLSVWKFGNDDTDISGKINALLNALKVDILRHQLATLAPDSKESKLATIELLTDENSMHSIEIYKAVSAKRSGENGKSKDSLEPALYHPVSGSFRETTDFISSRSWQNLLALITQLATPRAEK